MWASEGACERGLGGGGSEGERGSEGGSKRREEGERSNCLGRGMRACAQKVHKKVYLLASVRLCMRARALECGRARTRARVHRAALWKAPPMPTPASWMGTVFSKLFDLPPPPRSGQSSAPPAGRQVLLHPALRRHRRHPHYGARARARVCVCAYVRAFVRLCVRACLCVRMSLRACVRVRACVREFECVAYLCARARVRSCGLAAG